MAVPSPLWSATPSASDIGNSWASFTAANFSSVVTDVAGSIDVAPDGSPSLRAQFNTGEQYGFNDVCEPLVAFSPAYRSACTLRYEVFLDENIDYLTVADAGGSQTVALLTFPGLVGGEIWPGANDHAYPAGGEPQEGSNWSARIRMDASGRIAPYLYVQNRPGAFGWFRISSHPLRINDLRGAWSTWEQTCIMNTPGIADGRCILKINGETIVDVSDIEYRSSQYRQVGCNGIRLQAFVSGAGSPDSGAALDFDYWVRDFSIEFVGTAMANPLRLARENDIDGAVVTAGASASGLSASNLKTQYIRQVWRSNSGPTHILADPGRTLTTEYVLLINTTLGLADTVRVRVSTSDQTGAAGDAYDSGDIAAGVDPAHRMFLHFIEPGVQGRYLRIDGVSEAGRWASGQVFAPTRNMRFGWEPLWRDGSRISSSLGQDEFVDIGRRQRGFRFTLKGLTSDEAENEVYLFNRQRGTSRDILVCRDKDASNLGKVSIWGLLAQPVIARQLEEGWEIEVEVWERL